MDAQPTPEIPQAVQLRFLIVEPQEVETIALFRGWIRDFQRVLRWVGNRKLRNVDLASPVLGCVQRDLGLHLFAIFQEHALPCRKFPIDNGLRERKTHKKELQ
jgi:hypothetical protein